MADMDIEMDVDLGFTEDDLAYTQSNVIPTQAPIISAPQEEQNPILSSPNDTSEANALEPVPEKVHLRGLDNLTTDDIKAFVAEYFPEHRHSRIEWIDDTSANIVYGTAEIAKAALVAFAAVELLDEMPTLQTIQAKSFPAHPDTNLEVRIAVMGDRKQRGARERSKFYLFNPKYDPAERQKRMPRREPRTYRDRDDGGYRSQRYDDQEQEKRERESGFDASLYDDDEAAIAKRSGRDVNGQDSSSGSETRGRGRRDPYRGRRPRELFPDRDGGDGRLRGRSASPVRDSDGDQGMKESILAERRQDSAAKANRVKAQLIKARLRETVETKELFPSKSTSSHRHTYGLDAADEAADLFANRMAVPFMDGGNDERVSGGGSLASRIGYKTGNNSGFNIRGSAKVSPAPTPSFSIKGAAKVKELFPATLGDNAGKELFSDKLEGRGKRRQKAEDLFY